MNCRHSEVCRYKDNTKECVNVDFCKFLDKTHDVIKTELKNVTPKHKQHKRSKRGRKRKIKVFDSSEEGISAARQALASLGATGCLNDNQLKALEATKGIFYRKLTEDQKKQILSIYKDSVTEHREDTE
jgi:peptide methionine sulfoxide reductase MsrA